MYHKLYSKICTINVWTERCVNVTAQHIDEWTRQWLLGSKEALCDWIESNYMLNKEMLMYIHLCPSKTMWSLSLSFSLHVESFVFTVLYIADTYSFVKFIFKCTIYKDFYWYVIAIEILNFNQVYCVNFYFFFNFYINSCGIYTYWIFLKQTHYQVNWE